MIELIPELVDGAVICRVEKPCKEDCEYCAEQVVHVHNWLMETELGYLIFDLQDEKDICSEFLEELLHLRKRMRIPFLFAGVVDRPKRVLEAYNYQELFPLFINPEDAVRALRLHYPEVTEAINLEKVNFGSSICGSKSRGEDVIEEDTSVGDDLDI